MKYRQALPLSLACCLSTALAAAPPQSSERPVRTESEAPSVSVVRDVFVVGNGRRRTLVFRLRSAGQRPLAGRPPVVFVPPDVRDDLVPPGPPIHPIGTIVKGSPELFERPLYRRPIEWTAIDGFFPPVATSGTLVSLSGEGFADDDMACTLIRAGGVGGPVVGFATPEDGSGTPTSLDIRVNAVTPGATEGTIVYEEGEGTRATPSGGADFVFMESWVWRSLGNEPVEAAETIALVPPSPAPGVALTGCQSYYGGVTSPGQSSIDIVIPDGAGCPANSTIGFQVDACSSGGNIAFDEYVQLQNSVAWSTATCCARICQAFDQAYLNAFGTLDANCTALLMANGDCVISIQAPLGTTWDGGGIYLEVCR